MNRDQRFRSAKKCAEPLGQVVQSIAVLAEDDQLAAVAVRIEHSGIESSGCNLPFSSASRLSGIPLRPATASSCAEPRHSFSLINRTFIRPIADFSREDAIVFFLSRLIVEDFMEIVLLCGNGYGVAGLKILRGMYERVVTAAYLSKNPSETDNFLDYGYVQTWKLLKRADEVYGNKSPISDEQREKVKGDYDAVKAKFDEILCKECGSTRPQISWSKLDTASMALKAGDGLEQLYMACYLFPTLQSHATVSSLSARMSETPEGFMTFDEGTQRDQVDWALVNAHGLILSTIETQNRHFQLALDSPLESTREDFQAVWRRPNSTSG